jgi:hypothetical protein
MLNVLMLNVVMLNVVILNVVMLCVVARNSSYDMKLDTFKL